MKNGAQEVLAREIAATLGKGLFLSVAPSLPRLKLQFRNSTPFSNTDAQIHSLTKLSLPTMARVTLPGGPFLLQRQKEEGIIEQKTITKNPAL